jgi:threonine dehydratase
VVDAVKVRPGHGLVGPDAVREAAAELAGHVVRTPLLRSDAIERLAGATVLVKAENLQLGGSYKTRGALLAVGRLAAAGGCRGVVAQSTGNHGVALALAARRYGLPATVVLPADAAAVKVAQIRRAGGHVAFAGTSWAQRVAMARDISVRSGFSLVGATADVIAGLGTASWELLEQSSAAGGLPEALVIPVGGGGGIAGACLAASGAGTDVFGVEPLGCDSLARSLAAGRRVAVTPVATLADGLRPACVGDLPFRIAREAVTGVLHVDDRAISHALRLALFHLKLVVEPSAAAALAGALIVAATGNYRRIGVVLTGGNIDPGLLAQIVAERPTDESAHDAV